MKERDNLRWKLSVLQAKSGIEPELKKCKRFARWRAADGANDATGEKKSSDAVVSVDSAHAIGLLSEQKRQRRTHALRKVLRKELKKARVFEMRKLTRTLRRLREKAGEGDDAARAVAEKGVGAALRDIEEVKKVCLETLAECAWKSLVEGDSSSGGVVGDHKPHEFGRVEGRLVRSRAVTTKIAEIKAALDGGEKGLTSAPASASGAGNAAGKGTAHAGAAATEGPTADSRARVAKRSKEKRNDANGSAGGHGHRELGGSDGDGDSSAEDAAADASDDSNGSGGSGDSNGSGGSNSGVSVSDVSDVSVSDVELDGDDASVEDTDIFTSSLRASAVGVKKGGVKKGRKAKIEKIEGRKNRPGQRARQQQWESMYGAQAKHVSEGGERGARGGRGSSRGTMRGRGAFRGAAFGRGGGGARDGGKRGGGRLSRGGGGRGSLGPLLLPTAPPVQSHPSWAASQKRKAEASAIDSFAGKKMKFDE